MGLLIVILNYRTPRLTVDCLRSLAGVLEEVPGTHAVVVDNGSGDDSVEQIGQAIEENNWGDWLELLPLEKNLGFAGGNNAALRRLGVAPHPAPHPNPLPEYRERGEKTPPPLPSPGVPGEGKKEAGDYILLLNSDTILQAGALRHCRAVMEAEADIGMMSCLLRNGDGSAQNVTRDFPSPLRQMICALGLPWLMPRIFGSADVYDVPRRMLGMKRDCDWLGGAFMFIRVAALRRVGLMDESFFFYGEDIEFCHRFHRCGYRVHYDSAASIVHLGGSSSDATRMPAWLRDLYMWQARYQVQRKCYGAAAAWVLRQVDILAFVLRKAKMCVCGQRNTENYRNVASALSLLLRPLR